MAIRIQWVITRNSLSPRIGVWKGIRTYRPRIHNSLFSAIRFYQKAETNSPRFRIAPGVLVEIRQEQNLRSLQRPAKSGCAFNAAIHDFGTKQTIKRESFIACNLPNSSSKSKVMDWNWGLSSRKTAQIDSKWRSSLPRRICQQGSSSGHTASRKGKMEFKVGIEKPRMINIQCRKFGEGSIITDYLGDRRFSAWSTLAIPPLHQEIARGHHQQKLEHRSL